jgi:hypothetical protein
MAVVRPDVGPTLPALLRRRFGIPPAVTLAVAAVLAAGAIALIVWLLTRPPGVGEQVVHERAPVFNVLLPPGGAIRVARSRDGELMRLEGRRGALTVEVVVRPLELPPYRGDVTHGQLPAYADGFIGAAREQLPGMELTQEGRARVNNAVGYEIGFQQVEPESRTYGRDVLLVPDDPEEAEGFVTLSLRQFKTGGKLTKRERNLAFLSRKAYRSFRFGTDRG